jgi:hypothetical protein
MPEPTESGETPEQTASQTAATQGETPARDDQYPEAIRAILAKERAAASDAERKAKALQKERDALADEKRQREQAQLSETERAARDATEAKERAAQLERDLREERTRSALERAAARLGYVDPEDAYLRLSTRVEYGDDGRPANADRLVEQLAKDKPYLIGTTEGGQTARPGTTPNPRPAGSASRDDQIKRTRDEMAASGRYVI